MELIIRKLTENDLPGVCSIYNWYIVHSTATFHTRPFLPEELREFIFLDHPVYQSFVILFKNQLAGYCYFTFYKNRAAYNRSAEVTIYLHPQFTGMGMGKAALQYMENEAVKVGLHNLIGIITGDNTASIALFTAAGYQHCAHFKNIGEKFGKILDVVALQKEI